MKWTKILSTVLVATSFGTVATLATPAVSSQASAKKSMASFPAKYRGTWYYYHGKHFDEFKIQAKGSGARQYVNKKWQTGYAPVKVVTLNKNLKSNKNNKYDEVLFMSQGWLMNVQRQNYQKGTKFHSMGTEGYKIETRHFKGKKVKSLYINSMWNYGSGECHLSHYYKTKTQAKAFNPTGASEDFPG